MKTKRQLEVWLAWEVLGKRIPRKAPAKASALHQRPYRNARYRRWVASLPSAVSGLSPCDPCHTGPHPFGRKASDLSCIPLTREEHRQYDQDPISFCIRHNLDVQSLVTRLNVCWRMGWREV